MAATESLFGQSAPEPQVLRIVVQADQADVTISRHIFGHFAEHLGRCIYGGFWVQDKSGNWGFNEPVIEALRRIRVPNLRWPGGCFADYYHWRDGIGPRAQRPRMVNAVWGGVTEDNSFGTHEYMELVRRLGAEPMIVGNLGSGTVAEMADWWEYVNHPGGSTLAELRKKNGHPEPFRVRFWGVGNESWGCGGNMTPEYYCDLLRRYATFLRPMAEVKPFVIAVGPGSEDYRWTEVVMREAGRHIAALDFHHYTLNGTWEKKGSATQFTEAEWFELMERALRMDELLTRHSTIMDHYDPRRRVALMVGEWGTWHEVEPGTNPAFLYQQNTLRDALVAGLHLNLFIKHAERVRMANLAQTVNVLQAVVLTEGGKLVLTPTYHVFDLYSVHQDAKRLPINVEGGVYRYGESQLPAISAAASEDAAGKVHLTLVNIDPHKGRTLRVEFRGREFKRVAGRILTAQAMNAHNTFENPEAVKPSDFVGAQFEGRDLSVELPPKSVVALELE
ncbi:MAG: alpha-N-arabinofuranosidase [candidate division KSB1 bacterium]|nr:alpha-N-arabinofuranosidase [candidate division KSB1 bacterium]